jgi:hypothetical protein
MKKCLVDVLAGGRLEFQNRRTIRPQLSRASQVLILTVGRHRIAEVDGAQCDVAPSRFGHGRRQHHDRSGIHRRDGAAARICHRKCCQSGDLRGYRGGKTKEPQQRQESSHWAAYAGARSTEKRHTKTLAEIHKAIEAMHRKPRGTGSEPAFVLAAG